MKSLKHLLMVVAAVSGTSALAAPPSPPSGKKWERVDALSDEFNGGSINGNKWFDYHPFWKGRLPSQFKKGNATVSGGHLILRSTSRVNNINQVGRPFQDHWIDAAAVVSKQKVAQPGWYYECRMKASDTAMSSSFWFRVGEFSEIDVIEHWGHATKSAAIENRTSFNYSCNTHVYGTKSGPSIGEKWRMPRKGRAGFETYGLWWKDANTLLFYYNDRQVMQVKPAVPFTEKLRLIFDTESLAPSFVGLPTVASLKNQNRNAMRVDWVRSYKLVNGPSGGGSGGGGTSGVPSVGQRIALKGNNGKYASSENGSGPMNCNRNSIGSWETFTVVSTGGGKIALRGSNGKYVSSENGNGPMVCNRNSIGSWESFTFKDEGGGKISLRGNNNKFVSSENGAKPMICNRNQAGGWEKFSWSVR